jgi:hypothetical protein
MKRAIVILLAFAHTTFAQGTAFTYQGQLTDATAPANGIFDFRFAIYDTALAGNPEGGPVTNSAVSVSNGLFTTTLDFGTSVFTGAERWLEIGVVTNTGAGEFTVLTPRQRLTATPYAVFSGGVHATGISGTIAPANIGAGTISSAMIATGAVTATQLAANSVTTSSLADGAVTASKIFRLSNWSAMTIANPTPAPADYFGFSVAGIGSDRVLIGAYLDDSGATDSGAAYVFNTNGVLLATITNPAPATSAGFGRSVAALGTDRLLIGADEDDTGGTDAGVVYLFSASGALLTTFTNPAPAPDDRFGFSVAAMGTDRVLIGAVFDNLSATRAGAAYLFSTNGALLTTFTNNTPGNTDSFGYSVAGLGDDRVVIGTYGDDDTGAADSGTVYLFSTNGALITTLTNPTPGFLDSFGISVAAVGTDRVLIGAPGDSTSANGAGAAYLFSTNGALLATLTNPAPEFLDYLGSAVAVIGNDRLLIGAYGLNGGAVNTGAAYLFSTNGDLLATFTAPTPGVAHEFGISVAGVGAGQALIGAIGDDTGAGDAGVAYLFSLDAYTPGLVADAVNASSIVTASLADGAVTSTKLADDSVTSTHITDGAVTITDLATNIGAWRRSGADIFYTNGNVGIGTGTPATALHVNGVVTATQFTGSGAGLTGVWKLQGNAGTTPGTDFLGTTDNQALELRANRQRALRLEPNPNSPRLIGGFSGNSAVAGAHGVVIGGGGFAGNVNRADALLTVIAGGSANTNAADGAFIGGGFQNSIQPGAHNAAIAGGAYNGIGTNSAYSAVGGGIDNNIHIDSPYSTIAGGIVNDIGTNSSSSTIGGGNNNNISTESAHATISGGLVNNIGTNSPGAAIGGGRNHSIAGDSPYATIVGGSFGRIGDEAPFSFIGGGEANRIALGSYSTVIGGGLQNDVSTNSYFSVVGGGENNNIGTNSLYTTIAGGRINDVGDRTDYVVIGGGIDNNIGNGSLACVIAGGGQNKIGSNAVYSTLHAAYGVIGGGSHNDIATDSFGCVIAGGGENNIGTNVDHGTICGGIFNVIARNSDHATIPGGFRNFATNRAFAAGTQAKANHSGAFVWADDSPTFFEVIEVRSTNNNSVTMRAAGGFRLFSNSGATIGAYLAPGSGSWTAFSDRNMKENFQPVNTRTVLDKVAALPLSTWNYKAQTNGVRHIGPMAQDFKAAFAVGETDTGITTVDADGVALAAIQGLNQKLEEQRAENVKLKERLARLERLMSKLTTEGN